MEKSSSGFDVWQMYDLGGSFFFHFVMLAIGKRNMKIEIDGGRTRSK